MEPINNQQINTDPAQQPVVNQTPNKGNGKGTMLLIIILFLIEGMGGYIIFANKELNSTEKNPTNQTITTVVTVTPTPTTSPDDLTVEDPETDIKGLEEDALLL